MRPAGRRVRTIGLIWLKIKRLSRADLGDPIPDARLGNDDARIAGIFLDFLPDLTDIDPQILGVRCVSGAPYRGQNLAVGNHPAGMFREK
jgi:hypothetical protein